MGYCSVKEYIALYFLLEQFTIQYKILEGENLGEFGELQEIHQHFLVQNFLKEVAIWYIAS